MTSGLDVPLESKDWGWLGSEQDVAHLGGEAKSGGEGEVVETWKLTQQAAQPRCSDVLLRPLVHCIRRR